MLHRLREWLASVRLLWECVVLFSQLDDDAQKAELAELERGAQRRKDR
jgi:hypothetical protein